LNIFETQTDFITRDPRTDQAIDRAFTAETQLARFEAWIPPVYLKDKSVLDLGCCLGAFGAYALSNGARRYVGVEISKPLAAIADENLTKYYSYSEAWDIVVDSCETFLENNLEEFDYILAGGVLHAITNFLPVLTAMAACGKVIVIESVHPSIPFLLPLLDELGSIKGEESYERLHKLMLGVEYSYPFVSYNDQGKMMHHNNREAVSNVLGILPSMGALKIIMNRLGYKEDIRGYTTLKKAYPEHYGFGRRFLLAFVQDSKAKPMSYSELIDSEHKTIMEWKDGNAKGTI
jgi:SAM-dependent methyltransferase